MAQRDHARLHTIKKRHVVCPSKSSNGIGWCDACWLLAELERTDEAADAIQDKLCELQRSIGWAEDKYDRDRH